MPPSEWGTSLGLLEEKTPIFVEDSPSQWSFSSASSPFCTTLLDLTGTLTRDNRPLPPSQSQSKLGSGQESGGKFGGLICLPVWPKMKLIWQYYGSFCSEWDTGPINIKVRKYKLSKA